MTSEILFGQHISYKYTPKTHSPAYGKDDISHKNNYLMVLYIDKKLIKALESIWRNAMTFS